MIGEESEFQEFCMSIPQVAPSPKPINSVEYHDQCSTFKENRASNGSPVHCCDAFTNSSWEILASWLSN